MASPVRGGRYIAVDLEHQRSVSHMGVTHSKSRVVGSDKRCLAAAMEAHVLATDGVATRDQVEGGTW